MQPVLLIHGGAGPKKLSPEARSEIQASITGILNRVYPLLVRGKSALEAVREAVILLENDPLYNAGKGSKIQSDGKIRLSASIMDGHQRRFAGCVNVEGVKNPIRLAHKLLRKEDRVLSTAGAKRMAQELGLEFASPFTRAQVENYRKRKSGKSGTVGAVALDRNGRLAAATSTGGRGFEFPFRVSDSPTSAGNFATDKCAVSATGTGEQIVEHAVASSICALVDAGFPLEKAARRVLTQAKANHAQFGLIALDKRGQVIHSTLTPLLIWGEASGSSLKLFR